MRNYKKSFEKYKALFKAEKKIGNVKNGVKQLTYKQYQQVRNIDKYSNAEIIRQQTILDKAGKKRAWSDYQKIIKKSKLKPGESDIYDNSYWGENIEDIEGLNYHKSLSGLLKDRHSLHFIISDRIIHGEDKDGVLKDYGY